MCVLRFLVRKPGGGAWASGFQAVQVTLRPAQLRTTAPGHAPPAHRLWTPHRSGVWDGQKLRFNCHSFTGLESRKLMLQY